MKASLKRKARKYISFWKRIWCIHTFIIQYFMSNLSLICYPNGNGRLFYIIFFAVCRAQGCVHSEIYIVASYTHVRSLKKNKGHETVFYNAFPSEVK